LAVNIPAFVRLLLQKNGSAAKFENASKSVLNIRHIKMMSDDNGVTSTPNSASCDGTRQKSIRRRKRIATIIDLHLTKFA